MNSVAPKIGSMRELSHRYNDGIDVRLFWHPDTDEVIVCVCDQRRGAYFEVEPGGNNALDAFYHPFSYASLSCVDYENDRLAAGTRRLRRWASAEGRRILRSCCGFANPRCHSSASCSSS
jgi:hypothetical protein